MPTEQPTKLWYYYVTFSICGPLYAKAVKCIRQNPTNDGFNFIQATGMLEDDVLAHTGVPCRIIIENWKKITEKRFDQFLEMLARKAGGTPEAPRAPATILTFHQGGKDKPPGAT